MARTALTISQISLAGGAPAAGVAGDVANGNVVANDGDRVFVIVKNTSGTTAYNVTFTTPGTVGSDALAIADKVKLIAISGEEWFGPFPVSDYSNLLQIDVQNVALTLRAVKN